MTPFEEKFSTLIHFELRKQLGNLIDEYEPDFADEDTWAELLQANEQYIQEITEKVKQHYRRLNAEKI